MVFFFFFLQLVGIYTLNMWYVIPLPLPLSSSTSTYLAIGRRGGGAASFTEFSSFHRDVALDIIFPGVWFFFFPPPYPPYPYFGGSLSFSSKGGQGGGGVV